MRRSLDHISALFFAVLLLTPSLAFGQQITVFDGAISHTDQTGAFLSQPSSLPADLTAPDAYSTGTLHYRVDVTATPGMRDTGYAICFVQGANQACSDYANLTFTATGEATGQQAVNSLTNFAAIDWTMAFDNLLLVASDVNGYPVDATDTMWDGSPDFSLYYQLDLTFQAVLVANGGTFSGFPGQNTPMKVANPAAAPAGGSYDDSVQVTLTTSTANATIYYTTDGSDPDDMSAEYGSPLTFTSNTTLKARAYAMGMDPSDIISESYTITQPTNGLRGRYYNGRSFGDLRTTRTDRTIDFAFGDGESPAPDTQANNFSILWTGTVEPQYTGQMTFKTINDDGVRVWVDNKLIINDWNFHGPQTKTGVVSLQANQEYDIWIEYFNGGGSGEMRLMWTSDQQPEEIIPDTQLRPNSMSSRPTVSLFLDEDNQTVAETSTTPVPLTVSRRGALDSAVRVELTFDGTAVNGEDYESVQAYVDIPAGALSATFDIQPIVDGIAEGEETIEVAIAESGSYLVGDPNAQTMTLLDFDVDTFTIAGEVVYTGTESGKIFVQAFTDDDEQFEKRQIVLIDPGTFAITDVEEGAYNVVAFIDTNDNERLDPDEIWNQLTDPDGNPTQVTIPSPESTAIVLNLDQPSSGEPPGTAEEGEDDGGCSTSGSGHAPVSGLIILLGLIVGIWRRQR